MESEESLINLVDRAHDYLHESHRLADRLFEVTTGCVRTVDEPEQPKAPVNYAGLRHELQRLIQRLAELNEILAITQEVVGDN